MVSDTGNRQSHVSEYALFQDNGADKMSRANLFPLEPSKVRKYLDLDELTPSVLNDMVKAVYVHAPDKSKGHRERDMSLCCWLLICRATHDL